MRADVEKEVRKHRQMVETWIDETACRSLLHPPHNYVELIVHDLNDGSGGLLNNVGVPANIAKPNSGQANIAKPNSGQTELSADVALQDHQRARSPKNPLALVPPQGGRVVKVT